MACVSYKAKAPGSLMLLGEYAVLRKQPALAMAIDRYIQVTLTPTSSPHISLFSQLGSWKGSLMTPFALTPPFEYVFACLNLFSDLPSGFECHIEADFPPTLGLGSSAAVTVALLSALWQWCHQTPPDSMTLLNQAIQVIRAVQGKGSGTDAAASMMGGVVALDPTGPNITRIHDTLPFHAIYTGKKVKTGHAIQTIFDSPFFTDSFLSDSKQWVELAIPLIQKNAWKELGAIFRQAQKGLQTLGVSTPIFDELIHEAQKTDHLFGEKISGSGFGDCMITLGEGTFTISEENSAQGVCYLPLFVSQSGIESHVVETIRR